MHELFQEIQGENAIGGTDETHNDGLQIEQRTNGFGSLTRLSSKRQRVFSLEKQVEEGEPSIKKIDQKRMPEGLVSSDIFNNSNEDLNENHQLMDPSSKPSDIVIYDS